MVWTSSRRQTFSRWDGSPLISWSRRPVFVSYRKTLHRPQGASGKAGLVSQAICSPDGDRATSANWYPLSSCPRLALSTSHVVVRAPFSTSHTCTRTCLRIVLLNVTASSRSLSKKRSAVTSVDFFDGFCSGQCHSPLATFQILTLSGYIPAANSCPFLEKARVQHQFGRLTSRTMRRVAGFHRKILFPPPVAITLSS